MRKWVLHYHLENGVWMGHLITAFPCMVCTLAVGASWARVGIIRHLSDTSQTHCIASRDSQEHVQLVPLHQTDRGTDDKLYLSPGEMTSQATSRTPRFSSTIGCLQGPLG